MPEPEKNSIDSRLASLPPGITRLLSDWCKGDKQAFSEVMPLLYNELRHAASRFLKRESGNHTLQTVDLVNEVYLRLVKSKKVHFENREQFFYFTCRLMRHILVEHARKRLAMKRGSGAAETPLDDAIELSEGKTVDFPTLITLDQALENLEEANPRQCRIVELRFFAGMNSKEIGEILGISLRTIVRDWEMAKRWLSRELSAHGIL